MATQQLYREVRDFLGEIAAVAISEEREVRLAEVSRYLADAIVRKQPAQIICVCTENSRRSHLTQVWLQVAAWAQGVDLRTFSAGTQINACNPRTTAALERAGLLIGIAADNTSFDNPVYEAEVGGGREPLRLFSKSLSHASLPKSNFAAMMVCSAADAACPTVPGAQARFSIPFEDPKSADDTAQEAVRYDAISRQIAAEMNWIVANARALAK